MPALAGMKKVNLAGSPLTLNPLTSYILAPFASECKYFLIYMRFCRSCYISDRVASDEIAVLSGLVLLTHHIHALHLHTHALRALRFHTAVLLLSASPVIGTVIIRFLFPVHELVGLFADLIRTQALIRYIQCSE